MSIRLPNGLDAHDFTTRLITDITQSVADSAADVNAVIEDRNLLNPVQERQNKPWKSACELHVPYVKQTLLAIIAHISPVLLGNDPIFHANPAKRDDTTAKYANAYEKYQQEQLRVIEFAKTMENIAYAAGRDGTAGALVTWDIRTDTKPKWRRVDGEVVLEQETVTTYDAPRIDFLPLERFGTFPSPNVDIQLSPGIFYKMPWTGDAILRNVGKEGFDKAAVEALMQRAPDEGANLSASSESRGITDTSSPTSFHSRTYELTHVYYRIGAEDSTKPAEDWYFVIDAKNSLMLEARRNPWFHQLRPLVAVAPYRDVEGHRGDSVSQTGAGQVQLAQTTLMRLGVDGTAKGIAPTMLVAESMFRRANGLLLSQEPGGSVPFPDDYFMNGRAGIQPFSNGGYQPTIIMPMMEMTDRIGERSSGMNDASRGMQTPGNITATEAQQIAEGSQKIIAFLTERFAKAMAEIANLLWELNYQFQGNDGPQEIWERVIGDEIDMFDVMETPIILTTSGVRDTNNRAIRARQAMERVSMLMSLPPPVIQAIKIPASGIYNLLYDAMQANGVTNPERYLGEPAEDKTPIITEQPPAPPQPQGMPAGMLPEAMMMAQGGMPPQGMPMPPQGQPMPQQGGMPYSEEDMMFLQNVAQQLGIPIERILQLAEELGFPPVQQLLEVLDKVPREGGV